MNKKLIALILAFALMFSTLTVAFADTAIGEEASIAVSIGMLKGDGNGVTPEYLATQPTRLQAAIMYLRLRGLEEEALEWTGTDNFPDAIDYAWEGGKAIMAYLKSHPELGWQGADGMFLPNDKINSQSFYKVMLEALGYKQNTTDVIGDFTWAGTFNFAADLGMIAVADVASFTVNDLAIATLEGLVIPVKSSEMTLAATLVEAGVIDMEAAITVGLYEDPAIQEAIDAAITAAEEAIAALPTTISVDDKDAVAAARVLVDEAMALYATAVISNIDVLEAAEAALVTLDDAVAAAVEAITALPATITVAEKDAVEAARALVTAAQALNAEVVIENITILEAAEATIATIELPIAVESVSGTNLTELVVKFNKAVDKDTVIAANFKIGTGVNATTPVLGEDAMTVTVAINTADVALTQPANYALVIDKVKDTYGNAIAKTEQSVKVFDNTLPTVTGVALTAPDTFTITFSEPMKTVGTVKLNNGIYAVTVPVAITTNEATITITASSLPEGNYTVEIAGYKDYAGFAMDTTTMTLVYAKDTTLPAATIKSAEQTQVVVTFDKEVVLDNTFGAGAFEDYFYHTFSTWAPDTVTTTDNKTFTLTFTTYPVPEGNSTLVVKYKGNAPDSEIKDAWNNKWTANTNFTLQVTADKTAPTVTNVKVTNEKTVIIYFSEDMDQVKAEDEANFIVKDADGKVVTTPAFTNAYTEVSADNEYYVTMTFGSNLTGGNYTVEIKGQEDEALMPNALAVVTKTFAITDLTAINPATNANDVVITAIESAVADTADVIYVTYGEKMATSGQYSVLSTSNYLFDSAALPAGTTIEAFGSTGKVVKISIPDGSAQVVVTHTLTIGRVADLAGNTMVALSYTEAIGTEAAPTVTEVRQTDYNKITIIVNKPLSVVLASGFDTGANTLASIDSWSINSDNQTVINATVTGDDASDAIDTSDILTSLDVVADILVAETGVKMAAASIIGSLKDFRIPTLIATNAIVDMTTLANNDMFEIKFTEALNVDAARAALMAHDLVITDTDGNVLVAGIDYTTTVNGNSIEVAIAAGEYKVKSASTIKYIADNSAQANLANVFTSEVTVTVVNE